MPTSPTTPPSDAERQQYPHFARLLSSRFHQDFDIDSDDFRVIVQQYKQSAPDGEPAKAARDVERFIQRFGQSDASLTEATERVFEPEVIIEGWDGLTTREWLSTVAELLKT